MDWIIFHFRNCSHLAWYLFWWCPNKNRRWIKLNGWQSSNTLWYKFHKYIAHIFWLPQIKTIFDVHSEDFAQSFAIVSLLNGINKEKKKPHHLSLNAYSRQQNCHNIHLYMYAVRGKKSSITWWTNRVFKRRAKHPM